MDLRGCAAFVAGGPGDLGAAICPRVAREGCDVAVGPPHRSSEGISGGRPPGSRGRSPLAVRRWRAMRCVAICVSGIANVVIGARYARMSLRYGDYAIEKLLALLDQPVAIIDGILYEEGAALRLESVPGRARP